jgi:hypothetical protein
MEQAKPREGVFELLHLLLNSLHESSSAILPRALTPDLEFVSHSCSSNKQRRREESSLLRRSILLLDVKDDSGGTLDVMPFAVDAEKLIDYPGRYELLCAEVRPNVLGLRVAI